MLGMHDLNADQMTKKLEETLPVIQEVSRQFKNPVGSVTGRQHKWSLFSLFWYHWICLFSSHHSCMLLSIIRGPWSYKPFSQSHALVTQAVRHQVLKWAQVIVVVVVLYYFGGGSTSGEQITWRKWQRTKCGWVKYANTYAGCGRPTLSVIERFWRGSVRSAFKLNSNVIKWTMKWAA